MNEDSIAKQVREQLIEKPFLEDSIIMGIANLSKVAKFLKLSIKGSSFHAVHAALRRQSEQIIKERSLIQANVLKILKKSNVSIKSGLISATIAKSKEVEKLIQELSIKGININVLSAPETTTIVLSNEFENELKSLKKYLININKGLGAIIIKSPKEVVFTKGFLAFLTNLISRENINIINFMWSYENTIIVVDKNDAGKVFNLLTKFIE